MPLDSTRSITITEAVNESFDEIGRAIRTMLPKATTAKDRLAAEYLAASLTSRLSEAWRDKTKRAAVGGGVLPDHTADPFPVGTVETVYTGALVTISVKVVEQADRVDVAGLVASLEKAGVKPTLLKRLVKKHTKSFAGAHVFTASLA